MKKVMLLIVFLISIISVFATIDPSVGINDPDVAVSSPPQSSFPNFNQEYLEPVFGTTLKRIGNPEQRFVDDIGVQYWERHIYSQLQAFNSDNSLILLNNNGQAVVRDVNTLEVVRDLSFATLGNPRWNPLNGEEIIYFDEPQNTINLRKINVRNGEIIDVGDISSLNQDYNVRLSTPSNEEFSQDGRWVAMYVDTTTTLPDGSPNQAFIAFDMIDGVLGAELTLIGDLHGGECAEFTNFDSGPDFVAASPSGRYMVIKWNREGIERCQGVEVYDMGTGEYVGHVSDRRAHSDITRNPLTGEDVYVTFYDDGMIGATTFPGAPVNSFNSDSNENYFKFILDAGVGHTWHVGCQGPDGTCVVTSEPEYTGRPFDDEIYLLSVQGALSDN
jgi:hypothetical protein